MDSGITPQQIADIAKDALVARAAAGARMTTGRINHSRVAAATGLSRSEVRSRLARVSGNSQIPLRSLDRTSRVIAGWMRDPQFLGRDGKPKDLPLSAPNTSFASLVRMHSGDIPPRVVLDAMLEKGLARLVNGKVVLISQFASAPNRHKDALSDSAPYVAQFLATASLPESELGFAHQIQVLADDKPHEILLTEHVVRTLAAAIGAIESRKSVKRKAARSTRELRVTLTMVSAPHKAKN